MSLGKKTITTVLDIFGYSLIGVLSFLFGIVLQNYNSNNVMFTEIVSYGHYASSIVLLICFQIVFTCLFGFSYATVFFNDHLPHIPSDDRRDVFSVAGNWIEVILICLVTAIFVVWVINPTILQPSFFYIVISSGIPYILSSMVYRMKNRDIKDKKAMWLQQSKFVLVCPAILMIGFNIYIGSSIFSLLKGELVFYFPIALFTLLLVSFYISSKAHTDIAVYIIFSVLLVIVGFLSFNSYFSTPSRNAFLAVMTSIFLAIFECWYIAFRQLKDTVNKKFVKVTSYIVIAAPTIVFSLYPIQDFNIIYFLSFYFGMIATQYLWFFYILPRINSSNISVAEKRKLRTRTGVLRAIFGVLVLLFLTLDKQFGGKITPSQVRETPAATFEYGLIIAAITALVPIIMWFVTSHIAKKKSKSTIPFWTRVKNSDVFALFLIRIGAYAIPILALMGENRFVFELDIYKQDISFYGMLIFGVIDFITICCLLYRESNNNKSVILTK